MNHDHWMQAAIDVARRGIARGQSPFGSVIVRDGRLVAEGHNEVWLRTDPTAHAEVVCIQAAARALQSVKLDGCTLYSTCEPCPMCAAAIHWAGIAEVRYGATILDARNAGFDELALPIGDLYRQGGSRVHAVGGLSVDVCAALFAEFTSRPEHRLY